MLLAGWSLEVGEQLAGKSHFVEKGSCQLHQNSISQPRGGIHSGYSSRTARQVFFSDGTSEQT